MVTLRSFNQLADRPHQGRIPTATVKQGIPKPYTLGIEHKVKCDEGAVILNKIGGPGRRALIQ